MALSLALSTRALRGATEPFGLNRLMEQRQDRAAAPAVNVVAVLAPTAALMAGRGIPAVKVLLFLHMMLKFRHSF